MKIMEKLNTTCPYCGGTEEQRLHRYKGERGQRHQWLGMYCKCCGRGYTAVHRTSMVNGKEHVFTEVFEKDYLEEENSK